MGDAQVDNSKELTLFAVLLGSTPLGRNIEQHDMMFAVANNLDELTENIKDFWRAPVVAEAIRKVKKLLPGIDAAALTDELNKSFNQRVHIDAWMPVNYVDGYKVTIVKNTEAKQAYNLKLFFINLGGYKEGEFEEYHKKFFVVAETPSQAVSKAMKDKFMNQYSPESLGKGGQSHLDDQIRIEFEADDIICVSETIGSDYAIELTAMDNAPVNEMHVGYIKLEY